MAARTVTRLPRYCTVVEYDLQPIGGVMAYVTGLSRRYVIRILTGGNGTVVAVLAQVRGLAMVQGNYVGLPSGACGMTGFAHIGAHRVCGGFVRGVGPRVTGRAGIGGLIMGEWGDQRHPARTGGMA
jgi:hypothetical protein